MIAAITALGTDGGGKSGGVPTITVLYGNSMESVTVKSGYPSSLITGHWEDFDGVACDVPDHDLAEVVNISTGDFNSRLSITDFTLNEPYDGLPFNVRVGVRNDTSSDVTLSGGEMICTVRFIKF